MDVKLEIEKLLGGFWDRRALEILEDPLATEDLGAPLDSISACDAFVGIDKIVNCKLPVELIVRHGGYTSRQQFVTQITDGVLKYLGGGAGG